jgi:SAM-dependent methyltransferase
MEVAKRSSAERYDASYFRSHCGDEPYARNELWLGHFARVADRLVADLQPKTALDVGCAWGFLVESLRDRGVEAYGIDVSQFAIDRAREDIRPYCRVASATEPLTRDYDFIVCIEVLEHLAAPDAEVAVENFCAHTGEVIFSSTADDFTEATHVNVRPPEYWAALFARHGFLRDIDYEATYISPAAVRYRRSGAPLARVVRDYERANARLVKENQAIREALLQDEIRLAQQEEDLQVAQAEAAAASAEINSLRDSVTMKVAGRAARLVNSLFPAQSRRGHLVRRAARKVLR